MTMKQVVKLNIEYRNSPYIFFTYGGYLVNDNYYEGVFVYTTLTDYPQLAIDGTR